MPRQFLKAREPFSSYSHFIGAVLSGIGLIGMILKLVSNDTVDILTVISTMLFCFSLIALYSASSIYHFSLKGEKVIKILKKLDHSMIYVLIAGSYTPIILAFMERPKAIIFTSVIWAIAILGIIVKLFFIDAPRFIGTILYLVLGWAIAFDFSVVLSMPANAIALLAAGGISYTIGGIIYILKKPNISTTLGFHELFHIFVIIGSVCHYFMVFWYVI